MRRCSSYKLLNCFELLKCHLPNPNRITENKNKESLYSLLRSPISMSDTTIYPAALVKNLHVILYSSLLSSPHPVHHKSCCPVAENILRSGQSLVTCIVTTIKPEPLPRAHVSLLTSFLLNKLS